jgi:hypothetical protein
MRFSAGDQVSSGELAEFLFLYGYLLSEVQVICEEMFLVVGIP